MQINIDGWIVTLAQVPGRSRYRPWFVQSAWTPERTYVQDWYHHKFGYTYFRFGRPYPKHPVKTLAAAKELARELVACKFDARPVEAACIAAIVEADGVPF
jgi:hypothetical protein